MRRSRRRFFFGIASLLIALLFLHFGYFNYNRDKHEAVWVMITIAGVFGLFFWKFIFRDRKIVELAIDERGIMSNQYEFIAWDNVLLVGYLKANDSTRFVPRIMLLVLNPVGMKGAIGRVLNLKRRKLEIKMADINVKPVEIYDYARSKLHEYRSRHGGPKRTGDAQFDAILDKLDELRRKIEEALRYDRQQEVQRLFEEAMKLISAQGKRLKQI